MVNVTYYYHKENDPDGSIKKNLEELGKKYGFALIDICLDDDPNLSSRIQEETALQIGPYRLHAPFNDIDIQIAVKAYQGKLGGQDENSRDSASSRINATKISGMELFSFWLSKNYVWSISIILMIFVGFTFLAPVLMKANYKKPAQVLYDVYSVFCHQLAYRSFFLYGEQIDYPRELAGVKGVITYEQATGKSAMDTSFARSFTGNEVMGYKVAICERDIAIYVSLLIASILFQLTGRKWKSFPWYFWVIIAVLPILIDGGTQLFSLGGTWPAWIPIRESTPFERVFTGALFGFFTGWYVYPMMEEGMSEIRLNMTRKLAIKRKLIEKASRI